MSGADFWPCRDRVRKRESRWLNVETGCEEGEGLNVETGCEEGEGLIVDHEVTGCEKREGLTVRRADC